MSIPYDKVVEACTSPMQAAEMLEIVERLAESECPKNAAGECAFCETGDDRHVVDCVWFNATEFIESLKDE